jgi:threonine synthase
MAPPAGGVSDCRMHTTLSCSACGKLHAIDRLQNLCTACARPLLVGYDLGGLRGRFTPQLVQSRPDRSMWRFAEVLPVDGLGEAVTLGEGGTPLLKAVRRGPFAPFTRLAIKDEALNPTASFKSRGMSAAVTCAARLGAKVVALPSAGNAGGAAAAYAARAGLECLLFMPCDTPQANIVEAAVAGANVFLVNGLISDCGAIVRQGCDRFGWFDLSTLKEPFRLEGKKTLGYELALDVAQGVGQPGALLPNVIVYPAGGGTGLVGMWKAFGELEALGWVGSHRPRMVLVQAENCAPIVRAWREGAAHAKPFANASTVAAGLRVPSAVGDFLMLEAVRSSGGTAVTVSDEELLAGVRELAAFQGIYACPEGGAAWKAVGRLLEAGWLTADESIVVFNTGSGLKYNHLFPTGELERLDHRDPKCLDQVARALARR